jgi:hypothetical protein
MAWVVMEVRGEGSRRPPFGVLGEWSVLALSESVEAAEHILAEPPPTDAELTAGSGQLRSAIHTNTIAYSSPSLTL